MDIETTGTKDEHSYAYTDRKQAFMGKEKDHCYTSKQSGCVTSDKVQQEHSYSQYRDLHSMSDEDVSQTNSNNNDFLIFKDWNYVLLPHYHSSDSALDVTGFDSISEKCLSSENINVKTVDVFTDKCISHCRGISDPDISKMSLQWRSHADMHPNDMIVDHNYSSFSKFSKNQQHKSVVPSVTVSPMLDHSYDKTKKEPLKDHSYDSRLKSYKKSGGVKGQGSENLKHMFMPKMNASAVTKSPFLDHSYQSVEKKSRIPLKYPTELTCRKQLLENSKPKNSKYMFRTHLDHTYEKPRSSGSHVVGECWKRFRSNSLTELPVTDPSAINNDSMSDDAGSSDSGTESLNGEEVNEAPMMTDNIEDSVPNDHSYVYRENAL